MCVSCQNCFIVLKVGRENIFPIFLSQRCTRDSIEIAVCGKRRKGEEEEKRIETENRGQRTVARTVYMKRGIFIFKINRRNNYFDVIRIVHQNFDSSFCKRVKFIKKYLNFNFIADILHLEIIYF